MRLDVLTAGLPVIGTRGDLATTEVTSVDLDSRLVQPGGLFCCVSGSSTDGHDFAGQAVESGAVALAVERMSDVNVAQIQFDPASIRRATADLACTVTGHPAKELDTVGVTGTNAKTSVTHLIRDIMSAAGRPTVVIGTLSGARTTPEAPVLQRILRQSVEQGMQVAAMEVSSHAIDQHRVDGFQMDVAVFTNLSQDHLDYHRDMEDYFATKARLFTPEHAHLGLICIDDDWGRRLSTEATTPVQVFGATDATDVEITAEGTAFTWRGKRVRLPLVGAFHVQNALAAGCAASALGVDDDTVVQGLEQAQPIRGRFQVLAEPAPFLVVVDFAHTPQGLEVALASARALANGGNVTCVFGCGGERDHEKRPMMGRVAGKGADMVVVTSDNSRSEDPMSIIEDILSGMDVKQVEMEASAAGGGLVSADVYEGSRALQPHVIVEPDRRAAIRVALEAAEPGGVVLIAGKGHESTIDTRGLVAPFDDADVASSLLGELIASGRIRSA